MRVHEKLLFLLYMSRYATTYFWIQTFLTCRVAIVVTDEKSTTPNKTDEEAHRVRDAGIALTAVGIKGNFSNLSFMLT